MKLALCLLTLVLTACTLPQSGDVPVVPDIPAPQPVALVPEPPLTVFLAQPVDTVETCTLAPLEAAYAGRPKAGALTKAAPFAPAQKPQTPTQLVEAAALASRVEPSATGYFAGSAEQVYVYQPGKVFSIYLTMNHATGIFLPPGERLMPSLFIDPEAFDIKEGKGGSDLTSYGVIQIVPTEKARGETEVVLLTESGRRYLLRLIVGSIGMTAVSFEVPTLAASEPALAMTRGRP